MPELSVRQARRPVPIWLGVITIVVIALNLRMIFGATGPLVDEIGAEFRVSRTAVGLLTTLPMILLGLGALIVGPLLRRWAPLTAMTGVFALLTVGTALRSSPSWTVVVGATMAVGLAIAIGNVLVPVLIRMAFPRRIGLLTGISVATTCLSSGVSTALVVPAKSLFGGVRPAMGSLALCGAAGLGLCLLCLSLHRRATRRETLDGTESSASAVAARPSRRREETEGAVRVPRRLILAVTVFMGGQSLGAYTMMSWLAAIARDAGVSDHAAAAMLVIMAVASVPCALAVPSIAVRLRSQSGLVLVIATVGLTAYGLLATGQGAAFFLAPVLLGIAQSSLFALALTLMNLRARSMAETVFLSQYSQAVGYLLAATGPLIAGWLRASTGGWGATLLFLAGVLGAVTISGVIAGRPRPEETAAVPEPLD